MGSAYSHFEVEYNRKLKIETAEAARGDVEGRGGGKGWKEDAKNKEQRTEV